MWTGRDRVEKNEADGLRIIGIDGCDCYAGPVNGILVRADRLASVASGLSIMRSSRLL